MLKKISLLFGILLLASCNNIIEEKNISDTEAPAIFDNETQAISDTENPTTPEIISATAAIGFSISLQWSASTDNVGVTEYTIYRDNVEIATKTNLIYSDTGLSAGTSYSYSVSAIDAAGNKSDLSIAVSENTHDSESFSGVGLGINLGGLKDYTPSWAFVDRMKYARDWIPYNSGTSNFSSGAEVPDSFYDEWGYPNSVPFDPDGSGPIQPQAVRTLLFRGFDNYPAGTYTLIFEGTGSIELSYDGQGVFTKKNIDNSFEITSPSTAGLMLTITESDILDPITNIRVIMPGFENNYEEQIFHPLFLERLEGFEVIRFMDWGRTNGSDIVTWTEVSTPQHFSQNRTSGVSPYYMIALSNRLNADPWICIPHKADDAYIQALADLIDTELDPSRKVYIEYSNELWNNGFWQTHDIRDFGLTAGLAENSTYAGLYYQAKRSAEIFKIFEDTITLSRLVRVIAGQAANSWLAAQVLDELYNTYSSEADVYAIAPYFGGSIAGEIIDNGEDDSISIDEILNRTEASIYTSTAVWTENSKILADTYNIPLIAYEGGQHMVGVGEDANNETVTNKIIAANRDPRMKDLYLEMFAVWELNGGSLFTVFNNIAIPSKWGSWGILEYQNQPIEDAPKYDAIRQYIDQTN